jgi:hypothetical protein
VLAPSTFEQCHDLPEHRTALLSDLCSGSFHAVHPEVRARFTVDECAYVSSPLRDVVVKALAPGDGAALHWVDTGYGIAGVYNPQFLTRKLALAGIAYESGKTLVDVDAPAGGA